MGLSWLATSTASLLFLLFYAYFNFEGASRRLDVVEGHMFGRDFFVQITLGGLLTLNTILVVLLATNYLFW